MFENIIGQGSIVAQLAQEVSAGTLPPALLFYGEPYTGKLTTALELARSLTCAEGSGRWNCTCASCEMQRQLMHPYTLMTGRRYFETEIAACADVLKRIRKLPTQYLYVRAVRKLLRRFDPELWEGGEPKLKAVQPSVRECAELVEELVPPREPPADSKLDKLLEEVGELCGKIANALPDSTPIAQVRRIAFWAHTTTPGSSKIVIIEGADHLLESARNALLKLLEEPPAGFYLILCSTRRGGIMPTILSRVRPYHFRARGEAGDREVLEKIFRAEPAEYRSLRDYLLESGDTDLGQMRAMVDRFLSGSVERDETVVDPELLKRSLDAAWFRVFLGELTLALERLLVAPPSAGPTIAAERLASWNRLIAESAARNEQLNQSPQLLVERLFYAMKEEVCGSSSSVR